MSKQAARAGTRYGKLCTLLVLQGRVGTQQNRCGVKYNISFVTNFLRHITTKIIVENGA